MAIFNSYVKLPEGIPPLIGQDPTKVNAKPTVDHFPNETMGVFHISLHGHTSG